MAERGRGGGEDTERGSFERGTFETHEGEQRQLRAGGRKKEKEVEVEVSGWVGGNIHLYFVI